MDNYFDIHAQNYDDAFTFSSIGRAQRQRVHLFLSELLKDNNLNILELNCGTGEDANYLTNKGHNVLATDISSEMIAKAKDKYPTINFQTLDITAISSEVTNEKFDVIFSNFGGLNCLSKGQLGDFLGASQTLLKTNGKAILVLMPKKTFWERLYFMLKLQPKKAFRRNTEKAITANVEGVEIPTWYYNPKEVITLAKESLKPISLKPIGITIPPSYLESFFLKRKIALNFLIKIESWLSSSFWAKYADHYLIAFSKK